MATKEITSGPNVDLLIESLAQLQNVYSALKTFSETQDDLLQFEKAKSSKREEEIKKLKMTLSSLEKQHKENIEELRKEIEALNTALIESKRECDRLRRVHIDRNVENEKIYRLQDELEVVKAKLALQEEKHAEEISKRERQYTEELQKYQIMLESRCQEKNTKTLKHPAIDNLLDKRLANVQIKKRTPKQKESFRWPELDILKKTEPIAKNVKSEYDIDSDKLIVARKKKKLYCGDRETAVDV